MSTSTRPGPRERLLEAARELTYAQGVSVGVDAILKEADVARRSLYQHFGGKDNLVAEVLRTAVDEQHYRDALDSGGDDPRARIRALFAALGETVSKDGYHGCRYTAAELTITDPAHPAHAEVRRFKNAVYAMLRTELDKLGHPDPAVGAEQLAVLLDGVLVQAVTRPEAKPAAAVAPLVEAVLAQQ
jgi:AcrR family transcriptional regulator